ncbi:DUF4199 domain-containing protein [Algoriphagus sp. NF]|jgi:hypothetical protein|uniref:DUF4199 domain-containing protein n=1 Tax=Algoriphagus TaxID=246875 RepID=UPI00040D01B7|nr:MULTISPECIES: DUF4199 domain-containing protein [Algoriphagus]MCR9084704.1 DUF4199 domain-containing protein [Cyclobacteriaceae bacterium]MDE0559702.1 DUF4199 domain-containing protein [Algoriphagus sp. NF]
MEEKQTPFQAAVRPGLTIGLVSVALTFLVYFIDSSLLVAGWFGLVALAIFFVLVIFFGRQYRAELGGFMTFGVAFNFSFITMVVAGLISIIGGILLYQVIDPALPSVLAEQSVENTLEMMESFGASADSMSAEQLDEMRNSISDGFSLMGQIKSFGFALIFYAILSLITGAILKKKDKSLDY